MKKEIIMPKLGETMEEGYLVSWKKKEGDKVEKGEILFEVMSDKTNFEVESPYSGYLRKILFQPGDQPIPVTTVIAYMTDTLDEPLEIEEKIERTIIKESEESEKERIKISPVAKKLAEEYKIDITKIKGSGPEGRIEKKDILDYIEKTKKEVEEKITEKSEEIKEEYQVIQWSPLRKIIAKRLKESKQNIPHFYFQGKVIVDNLLKIKELKEIEGEKYTLTDFLIFLLSRVIEEFPLIGASVIDDEIRIYKNVDIGLAISIDDGLVVGSIKNANTKTIKMISEERKELVKRARDGKLKEEDIKGTNFVISNLGMYEIENFYPIINPPGVAIMGVGKIEKGVFVENERVIIKNYMYISFSFDHRVIDGVYAANFYKKVKDIIENPSILIFKNV
ncbi:MAG: 2-oxo acid dehydrogenase subunit E2 [Candidatus Omnitrophica bacterium]|nr:2-oxo acid dehydrogenase subunit E2 [Candidatus Omnitrophota bacterium]MCM8809688.1 2-oxo acid dehydrogenase subunit E2 [Candidatus Omnitrophota bacterium]MCM8810399.1 2-oxo acid dehydrogenase subunit E2 [Candidatus Omnitrophota bacterium]